MKNELSFNSSNLLIGSNYTFVKTEKNTVHSHNIKKRFLVDLHSFKVVTYNQARTTRKIIQNTHGLVVKGEFLQPRGREFKSCQRILVGHVLH